MSPAKSPQSKSKSKSKSVSSSHKPINAYKQQEIAKNLCNQLQLLFLDYEFVNWVYLYANLVGGVCKPARSNKATLF